MPISYERPLARMVGKVLSESMVGSASNPLQIPAADFNEFVTLVFGTSFEFDKVMDLKAIKVAKDSMFIYHVDDGRYRINKDSWNDMEVRVMHGDYPRFSVWTVLSVLCRLGYIAPGHYRIVCDHPIEAEKEEAVAGLA